MKVLSFPSAYAPGERPYDIFKDRMAAISSIVGGIKNIITNRYINKQNAMIAENIQTAIDEQKAIDLSNLILSDPPDEIYPANLEETVGQFYDKFAMGPMMKKEIMTGGLPVPGDMARTGIPSGVIPTGTLPGVTPTPTPTTEAMIPKTDMYQLYNAIKDLPTGQISWDNIYKKMTEKKPWFMGATGPEQYVLNQMLGQITDPRAKLASDINLAKLVKETFAPEEEKITSEIDFLRKDPEGYWEWKKDLESIGLTSKQKEINTYIEMYNRKEITRDELMKGLDMYVASEKLTDFEKKFNMFIDICEKNKIPITPDNIFKLFGAYVGEEKLKTPTYGVAGDIEEGFMKKVENITDFTNELNRLKGLKIDTSTFETTEYFAELMKKKYDEAIGVIQYCMRGTQSGEETDEDGLNYRDTYKEWWEKLRNYDEQYFIVTGQRLLAPPGGVTP